ncbi:MAG: RsmB/NOP family class I SAM-dependent RNA methyltransferase, partial [Alphaproteobacteria bacterium]
MDTPTTMPWWRDLARYRPLVDDWEAFIAALERPRGATLQVNVARTDRAALAVLLAEDGVAAEPLAWRDGGLRLPSGVRPGLSWAYRAGLYQIQDEAAMVPVALLDPQPGERVLDLCAAPGNKTAQIALALGNRGTVVANDVKPGRLATVHHTIARLGLLNVSTTALDGRRFPPVAGGFDKVLVDAPCSAEGTATHGFVPASPAGFRQWVIGVQRGLLARAAALCRPGGRIVYATCTYAPEENEAVVDWVLRALPGLVRLVPARLAGLALSAGLTEWQGRRFAPALADTARLWPQRAGTGGFFIAVLERTD